MPPVFLNEKSTVFRHANPQQVSDYVNHHVGSHGLRLSNNGSSSASLSHRTAGSLDLCRLSYGAQARVISPGLPDLYHVQFILRGQCHYTDQRDSLSLPAGHVLLINPEEPIDLTYSEDCEKFIVKIPSAMFNEACSEHRWFAPKDKLKFQKVPYKFEELDSLIHLLTLLCEEAESSVATPQMLQHYSRIVTSKLMTMLKHNVVLETPSLQSVSFERLVKYIDDNIRNDITAEDLAQYAHLSLRSLYMLFEKNAKMTPKCFIRRRKLERVYSTLMNPAAQAANVTAVALDYGFTHLGRFSEAYKATFGCLPSESLRKAQAQS